jgi:GTPase SAR1 family protein
MRPLQYPNTNVIVICFAVDSKASLESVRTKWHPEIEKHAPKVPLILCGTKCDLRQGGKVSDGSNVGVLIEPSEIERVQQQIGAVNSFEVSAIEGLRVSDLFEAAMSAYLSQNPDAINKNDRGSRCSLQ